MGGTRLAAAALALWPWAISSAVAEQADTPPTGSNSFCIFELPSAGNKRVWLNLEVVQYVELDSHEFRIYYGGGNLGSGHVFRLPISARQEGLAFLRRMEAAAVQCSRNE
ncbi:MAG: hypothetical protein H6R10_634 [Rhodocyclaceae bacterium]|nr:hypothetical protein [Rhodocyclaceae bacterium]